MVIFICQGVPVSPTEFNDSLFSPPHPSRSDADDDATFHNKQPERYVDANAIAGHLSVTRRQVLEMTRRGVIPGHPLGIGTSRKVWRYKISEVEAALACGVRKPSAPDDPDVLAERPSLRTIPVGSPRSQKGKL